MNNNKIKAKEIFEAIEGSISDYVAELNLIVKYEPSDFISDISNTKAFDEEGNEISIEDVAGKLFDDLEKSIDSKVEVVFSVFEELFENKSLKEIINSNWWNFNSNCWLWIRKEKTFKRKTEIAKAILRLDEQEGLNDNHLQLAKRDKELFKTVIQAYKNEE